MIIIVPARGGSKRVPNKNIRPLGGKPLIVHTIEQIHQAGFLDATWVSSDSEEILRIAGAVGARTIRRPDELAADTASTESALLHAIDEIPVADQADWIMTLPVTAPFRRPATIRDFADRRHELPASVDCLMSATVNYTDFWTMDEQGFAERLFPDAPRRQQERTPLFEEDSMIYLTRKEALLATGSILGKKVMAKQVDRRESFDINAPLDFELAEAILATQGVNGDRN